MSISEAGGSIWFGMQENASGIIIEWICNYFSIA